MRPGIEKRCGRCKEIRPLERFHTRGKTKPQYLQSHCKDCQKIVQREFKERLMADKKRYRLYILQRNDFQTRYREERIRKGRLFYVPLQERYRAIMQLS